MGGNPKFERFYPLRFLLSRDFAFAGLDWVIVITIPGETILEDINANMIVRVPAFKKQVQAFLPRVFNVISKKPAVRKNLDLEGLGPCFRRVGLCEN